MSTLGSAVAGVMSLFFLTHRQHWNKWLLFLLIELLSFTSYCQTRHTSNWAVLVDTSRFWFNYRHLSNTLAIYRHIKRLGIPDSRIIMMISDDASCSPRNPRPAQIFNNPYKPSNLYGESIEVDYRGYETTVENFIRVLTGRLPPSTPSSKRLDTDEYSNILIYMTGHGGDGFLKFQDENELSNSEFADVIEQMWLKKRYHEILFIVDTCQAASMGQLVYSPNIITIGSSAVGEDSLSLHVDNDIGVFMSDRYSYHASEFLKGITPESRQTMDQFLTICPKSQCLSTVVHRTELLRRPIRTVPVTDFFASVRHIEAGPIISETPGNQSMWIDELQSSPQMPKRNLEGLHYIEPLSV
ncbi:Phosphatidylinositol glycan [Paragonimus heterotremus]|uniref:Phosphatidylinositol glycan n=1 Tax=Paragonimus heterotremus TaxID=100268 RepID=A0A8J4SME5_9TREM|nr:Phosphatidylinositol glycan [Paragonimus heterotremus]